MEKIITSAINMGLLGNFFGVITGIWKIMTDDYDKKRFYSRVIFFTLYWAIIDVVFHLYFYKIF